MQNVRKHTVPRKLPEIRARRQQRLDTQRGSRLPQTQWCRDNGLEPMYFRLWKGVSVSRRPS